jgi:hypothetical protein
MRFLDRDQGQRIAMNIGFDGRQFPRQIRQDIPQNTGRIRRKAFRDRFAASRFGERKQIRNQPLHPLCGSGNESQEFLPLASQAGAESVRQQFGERLHGIQRRPQIM